jgi:hypothetical protein
MSEQDYAAVPLREYIEAVFEEQRRGMLVAETEREKAAKALEIALARSIEEGDRALREHVAAQVQQIQAALQAAEKLELQRFSSLEKQIDAYAKTSNDRLASLQREAQLVATSSETAINKANAATEKRLESLNELRAMVTDAQAAFLPREVADAQFTELRRAISELSGKISKLI